MVRWLRWHCLPDTGFEIRALVVWGRARYLSVTEAPHNTDFPTWTGKKHFFQTAETGNRTPNSGAMLTTTLGPPAQVCLDLWNRERNDPTIHWLTVLSSRVVGYDELPLQLCRCLTNSISLHLKLPSTLFLRTPLRSQGISLLDLPTHLTEHGNTCHDPNHQK